MKKIIQQICLRTVPILNGITGRKRSRLDFRMARYCYKHPTELNVRTRDGLRWKLNSGSHVDCLIAMDSEEPHILSFLKGLDLKGANVVDMGANVGGITLRLAKFVGAQGSVIAYEPNPDVANRLKQNLALNSLENVEVVQRGVWSSPGSFTLYLPAHGNSGTASIVDTASNQGGREIQVETEPFDTRWQTMGEPKIALVKMDIQGAEVNALKGMEAMLKACRPGLIIEVEGGGDNLPQRLSSIAKYLHDFGYTQAVQLTMSGAPSYSFESVSSGEMDHLNSDFYFS